MSIEIVDQFEGLWVTKNTEIETDWKVYLAQVAFFFPAESFARANFDAIKAFLENSNRAWPTNRIEARDRPEILRRLTK